MPDPDRDRQEALERLKEAENTGDKNTAKYIRRVLELLTPIQRTETLHLTLQEAIHRALATSYLIEVDRYNPAIEATRVIEAKAAFDAVFFTNITKNNIDRPSSSQLSATDVDIFTSSMGIRKLLPTGMQVSSSYDLDRTKTTLAFQSEDLNPAYVTNLVFEMRQPLLRGFGIDYNRSLIRISQANKQSADWAFRRNVRDLVRQVEEAYWRLVQARRDVVISARLLVDFEQILEYLDARRDFDIIPVQLNATQASLEINRAAFIRLVARVLDAEDQLVALMNSEDVDLADDVEIIPTDFPQLNRIAVDRVAEVKVALDNRSELKEQELQIEIAKLNAGRAKNQELPRLDFSFRQMYDGLAGNADRSFDKATAANFIEYFFGVEFEAPIGNRGPRAESYRAQLQYAASVALLKQRMEEVIFDVNQAVRELNTSYDQIAPSFFSAEARVREVDSIVARAERKDLNTLNSELNSRQSLAEARRVMLNAAVEYNIAIVDLERAKGTLLTYNNILIPPPEATAGN